MMLFWLVRKTRGAALPQTVVLSRRHISLPDLSGAFKQPEKKEKPFSESPAFYGRRDVELIKPISEPIFYEGPKWTMLKFVIITSTTFLLVIYLYAIRETRDYDELWDIDPRLLTTNYNKNILKMQIDSFKSKGKDTRDLQIKMLEIIAEEAEIRAMMEDRKEKRYEQIYGTKMPKKVHPKEEERWEQEAKRKRWFWQIGRASCRERVSR